jgi:hypothetical protein
VPAEHQELVRQQLAAAGYMPVQLNWDRPGARLLPDTVLHGQAEAFYLSLAGSIPESSQAAPGGLVGFVDEVTLTPGRVTLRGWAADPAGTVPGSLAIRIGDTIHSIETFEKQLRPDVQRHVGLPHALVGYKVTLEIDGIARLADLGRDFAVQASAGADPSVTTFRLAAPLARALAGE